MSYSDKFKVIWLNPMRTATRSCGIIQRRLGFEESATHNFLIPEDKIDYHYILNIRNPYSRIVSLYKLDRIQRESTLDINLFKSWAEHVLSDKLINHNISTVYLDQIIQMLPKFPETFIRTESLVSDIKNLWFVKENFDLIEKDFKEQIQRNNYINEYKITIPWQKFYTQELADFVYSKTENQFKLFNYEKDSWKDGTS